MTLASLRRRFGHDFAVTGEVSPDVALGRLDEMSSADVPLALLLTDEDVEGFLARAHDLHPTRQVGAAGRSRLHLTSPAVQAIALGRADYHLVRPWADQEVPFAAISDYRMSWTGEREPAFEMFRIVAQSDDPGLLEIRDTMTRFSMRFGR